MLGLGAQIELAWSTARGDDQAIIGHAAGVIQADFTAFAVNTLYSAYVAVNACSGEVIGGLADQVLPRAGVIQEVGELYAVVDRLVFSGDEVQFVVRVFELLNQSLGCGTTTDDDDFFALWSGWFQAYGGCFEFGLFGGGVNPWAGHHIG